VIGLFLSIIILMVLPFKKTLIISSKYNPIKKIFIRILIIVFTILTWIGANPVEYPFERIGQIFRLIYFLLVLSI
jgi:ubiquinol-cytochrome c reductase cytochrome b subunit